MRAGYIQHSLMAALPSHRKHIYMTLIKTDAFRILLKDILPAFTTGWTATICWAWYTGLSAVWGHRGYLLCTFRHWSHVTASWTVPCINRLNSIDYKCLITCSNFPFFSQPSPWASWQFSRHMTIGCWLGVFQRLRICRWALPFEGSNKTNRPHRCQ